MFTELEVLTGLEFVIMDLVDVTLASIGMLVEPTMEVLLETAGAQEFVVSAEVFVVNAEEFVEAVVELKSTALVETTIGKEVVLVVEGELGFDISYAPTATTAIKIITIKATTTKEVPLFRLSLI
ncbi:MAG: hypothetical protein ACHQ1H_04740 [Nitrososphaerales archaeon]